MRLSKSCIRGQAVSLLVSGAMLVAFPAAYAANSTQHKKDPSSFTSWLAQSKVTGQFREFYYTQKFQNILPFRHTNSLGGWFNIHTPGYHGWSLDAGAYTAQSLGLNAHSQATQIKSLPDFNLTVLGQAYLQYKGYGLKLRAGNQLIDTPFAQSNEVDFRMIPPMFQGIGGSYKTPVKGLSLYAYRMFRFRGFVSSGFERTDVGFNPYNVINPIPQITSAGFAAYGAQEHFGSSTAKLWYYDFYNRLSLAYGEYDYHMGIGGHFLKALLLGAQYAKEWNTGNQTLPYQNVDSELYGLRVGFVVPHNIVFLSYNGVRSNPGAFRAGGFVTPYLMGNYNTPTIYSNILGAAIGAGAPALPGHAYSIKDVVKFPHYHTLLIGAYTVIHAPDSIMGASGPLGGSGTSHAWEFIGKYSFSHGWATKVLYVSIDNNSALGKIQLLRFYLTYNFD